MTDDLDEGRSLELSHYIAVVRRRWYVVLVGVLVGVLGALAYLSTTPKSVTATTSVNVNVISSQPFDAAKPASQLFDPETEIQLATSSQVLGSAATELGNNKTLTQMRAHTVVQPVPAATVVKISYTAPTQAAAIEGADTIANDYLDYRSAAAETKVNKVVNHLDKQRTALSKALLKDNQTLANVASNSPLAVQADSDRQLLNIELTSLVAQINALDSVDTSGGIPVSSAASNPLKVSPNSTVVLGAGGLLGLILGVLLAFLFNALDRRVADGRALTGIGGGAILSELQARHAKVPAAGTDLDQVRSLRERLLASIPPGATLVVMDLVIRNRPSDVAVNLALSMVEGDDPVRLVLPNHSAEHVALLTGVLDLELTESLSDMQSFTSHWAPGLQIVVTREDHDLGTPGARLGVILSKADQPLRTTIVSMPPTAPRSLWLTAGRLGHSIILVAARRETRSAAVRQVVSELGAVGAVIHGSVLVPRRRTVDMTPVERSTAVEGSAPEQASERDPESDTVGEPDQSAARDGASEHQADVEAPDDESDADEEYCDVPLDFDEQSSEDGDPMMTRESSGRS